MISRLLGCRTAALSLTLVAALTAAGCDSSTLPEPDGGPSFVRSGTGDAEPRELLRAVRQSTARYHSTVQALDAGYQPDNHCVAVPGLGGMGYHWVNPSLVDGTFDMQQPEVLVYASGPSGDLTLVAVEYIVIDMGQESPSFGERAFDVGGTPVPAPHWSLHVWLYQENPNGIFTPFNPTVSCP